jgi:hypothetical protein
MDRQEEKQIEREGIDWINLEQSSLGLCPSSNVQVTHNILVEDHASEILRFKDSGVLGVLGHLNP